MSKPMCWAADWGSLRRGRRARQGATCCRSRRCYQNQNWLWVLVAS